MSGFVDCRELMADFVSHKTRLKIFFLSWLISKYYETENILR
jgi:hypothetical protein